MLHETMRLKKLLKHISSNKLLCLAKVFHLAFQNVLQTNKFIHVFKPNKPNLFFFFFFKKFSIAHYNCVFIIETVDFFLCRIFQIYGTSFSVFPQPFEWVTRQAIRLQTAQSPSSLELSNTDLTCLLSLKNKHY